MTCPALANGNDQLGKKVDPYWEYAPGIHGSEGPIGPCRYSRRVCRALAIAILSTVLAATACDATGSYEQKLWIRDLVKDVAYLPA